MNVARDTDLYCGVEPIDEQHAVLVGLLAALYHAVVERRAARETSELAEHLVFYARYHFACEEQWLDRYALPDLASHIAEHEHFTDELHQLRLRLREGDSEAELPMIRLLHEWLLVHNTQRDMGAVEAVLQRQGAACRAPLLQAVGVMAD